MYDVDQNDTVHELVGVPQSSVGAPLPVVLGDEHRVVVVYYLQGVEATWNGKTVRVGRPIDEGELVAIVSFSSCYAHMFGPPNDEAFRGHPLASRGLRPYGAYEVKESSWIRRLERMNSVHDYHDPERFRRRRHFVFTFHDSTFECVCDGFDLTLHKGDMHSAIPEALKVLSGDAG